jgi:hypothetical protein
MRSVVLLLVLSAAVCTPLVAKDRDGSWLIGGIREYERARDRVPNQTAEEAQSAVIVGAYIRGVLDAQEEIALKAAFYRANQKLASKADAKRLMETSTYITPLYNTTFITQPLQFDQYVLIIKNYLGKHPTEWDVDANQVIERALVEALNLHGGPMPMPNN